MVSFTANIAQGLKLLEQAAKNAEKGLARSSVHAAAIVRKNMVDSMPQGSRYNRSQPGQPPFKQTGRLARSLKYVAEGTGARIFSEYEGKGKRRGNGFLARLMETGIVGRGLVPTMKARPFTKPALDKSLSRLPVLLKTEVSKAI